MATYPKGPHVTAFRKFVDWLKTDPTLRAKISTWTDYGGDDVKSTQLPETVKQVPAIRFIPDLMTWERVAFENDGFGVASSPLDITIEITVPGFNWDDSSNIWDEIHRRIYSQDATERSAFNTAMSDVEVMDTIIVKPATNINDTGSPFTIATGKIRLEMYIPA